MTGLDKIISEIGSDSSQRIKEISDEANKKAEEISLAAEKKASEMKAQSEERTAAEVASVLASAKSSAELKKKQTVLEGKIEAIEDMLGRAVDVLKALPKREYFEMLKELAVKNALSGDGVMRFSKEDTAKLPQNFISSVNSALSSKGSVSLGEPCDIDSGFMLVYGDIDVNCTFSSLVSEKRDELFDELNKLLFN